MNECRSRELKLSVCGFQETPDEALGEFRSLGTDREQGQSSQLSVSTPGHHIPPLAALSNPGDILISPAALGCVYRLTVDHSLLSLQREN